jgi:hypothetical protein
MRLRAALSLLFLASASAWSGVRERDPEVRESRREVRHLFLRTEHPLLPQEREALESQGCRIVREVGGRDYIINVASRDRAAVSAEPFVAGISAIPASWRLHRSSIREAARFTGYARLNVLFHDDVSFDQARTAVLEAGGWIDSPLEVGFRIPRRLEIVLPDQNLDALAASDAVMQVHGRMPPIKNMNANAAAMSSVTPLHSAPYDLTGAGVVVSVFDYGDSSPALADSAHNEFEGRVIKHGTLSVAAHPTHVTGTIAAKGINPAAKGMAPAVRVENFGVTDDYLEQKDSNFTPLGVRADNNSWGYIHGWNNEGSTWHWYGDTENDPATPQDDRLNDSLFGAYGIATSGLDQIVRERQSLIVFASANDNNDVGASLPCFEHVHADGTAKFCFSETGTATVTCTAILCNGGFEAFRHKGDGPYGTVNLAASGKNTVAVGAVSSTSGIINFSSRGPTQDGRIKPEVVARGFSLYSTLPNQGYGNLTGTSMASPVVTGISALLVEQWRKTFAGANPGPDVLRVLLVHGAQDLGNPGPDYTFGFGLVNAQASVDTIINDGAAGSRIKQANVAQGVTMEFPIVLTEGGSARVTLGWLDPENTPYPLKALINDLDLKAIAPDQSTIFPFVLDPAQPDAAATRGINNRDNLEQIVITSALSGTYRIHVTGTAIGTPTPQSFVLASSVNIGAAGPTCPDPYEPNDSVEGAFGRLLAAKTIAGRTCSATDIDFYRFVADRSGPVSTTLAASDAPLRLSLLANGAVVQNVEVPAGSSRTIQTSLGSGVGQPVTPVTYTVRVEPTGTVGENSTYALTVNYPSGNQPRTRITRH